VPGLSDLTDGSAVQQAMLEFDEIGRDAFLTRYGYRPARSFFVVHGGKRYLTRLSTGLTKAFSELADLRWPTVEGTPASEEVSQRAQATALEFSEGERSQRESTFFRRNSRLRKEAIKRFGMQCVVCRMDFGERYGSAGTGYIEVHHLNPLAERMDTIAGTAIMTRLDEVVPVCANCHRVLHRRRPTMTIAELKASLR
jgi:predicted HNH restriction endonuclease